MQETGFSAQPNRLASTVGNFAGVRHAYYAREFEKIQSATRFPWSWNWMAALAGPWWGASRGLWGYFWTFLVLEVLALVQIGRGWWGDLGADKLARLEKLTAKKNEFLAKYEAATAAGDPDAAAFLKRAENLDKVAVRVAEEAALAAQGAVTILLVGIALLVVWIHGCLGLHYWLRLKPSYPRLQPYLFAAALLLPAAALSGFAAAGKQAAFLINDPLWREQTLALINLPGRDAVEWVYQRADTTRIGTAITVGIVLLLRFGRALWERRKRRVTVTYPDGRSVTVEQGCSVLDVSRQAGIPHASVCGGRGRCSTCRVRVAMGSVGLPPPSDEEVKVLRRVAAPVNVRLACQLRPNQDVTVIPLLPATAQPKDGFRKPQYLQGSEREIAILFADLRSFTKFSESKLPYDVVFVINQYFRLMGTAVETAGGRLDKFIGDGVMALFGVDNGLEQGCRDAINAARAMGRALDELNDNLENELDEPLRMGIGIHAGPAIVGEMGFRAATSVTAIGDSVNTASRLEAMTKEFESQLILSRTVTDAAGVDADDFPEHQIQVRGRAEMMTVYVLDKAADLPEQARENNRRNRRGDVNADAAPAR